MFTLFKTKIINEFNQLVSDVRGEVAAIDAKLVRETIAIKTRLEAIEKLVIIQPITADNVQVTKLPSATTGQ